MISAAAIAAGCAGFPNAAPVAQAQAASTPWPGGTWTPGEATYGSGLDTGISVTMSDGVILTVDISYPTDRATGTRAAGPFPVLLTQTPYKFLDSKAGDYFVQRGYIYVTAHVRGTLTSGGNFAWLSARDAQDGAELVAWAAKVQNSSGVVGLNGNSYMGMNQMHTMGALGAGSPVKAIAPGCTGSEFYRETYFVGGIPDATINFLRNLPSLMGGTTTLAFGQEVVSDIAAGGDKAYFRDFWNARTIGNLAQKVVNADVPVLLWSSNGDVFAQSSLELYAYLQNAYAKQPVYGKFHTSTPASGRYQIIISKGGHCAGQDDRIRLEWFDTWLKGVKTGMDKTAMPMHVHELISDRWLNTSHYPVVPNYTQYHLDNSNALKSSAPSADGSETIAWAKPSPTTSVQFDSPAFTSGGTLAGPVSASIYASSTTNNLELIASLQAIDVDGTVTALTSGTVVGSLSENDTDRSWFDNNGVSVRPYGKYGTDRFTAAGTIKKYDFAISPRFAQIRAGSKLRVVFTTQGDATSCTVSIGTAPCFPTNAQLASLAGSMLTIYHGPANDSTINLPLLKASCWRSSDNPNLPYWNTDPTVSAAAAPCQG